MKLIQISCAFTGFVMAGVFALGAIAAPQNAFAQGEKKITPELSDNLVQQLRTLGEEKRSRTAAQRKMGSQLVHAVKLRRGDPQLQGLKGFMTNVQVEADETTLVDIKAVVTPELLEKIAALGGTVVNSFAEYGAIRAHMPLDVIETFAEDAGVSSIRPAVKAFLRKADTSEGDVAHNAQAARTRYLLTGKNIRSGEGIKVGVLSDSVDYLSAVQATGDLPSVTVLSNAPGNSGEGTAMLEIIHDLAPDADLYFATAWNGSASFANNIKSLANAGCQVIVDDVGYLDESPFQDGVIAQAVNTVTSQGVLYFSSAGNAGNLNDGTSGAWEGDYRSMVINIDGGLADVHNFGGGDWANRITLDNGCYTLFWADPLGGSNNDYDLYLVDPTLTSVVGGSTEFQNGSQDPLEGFCVSENVTGYSLLISQYQGQNRFMHLSANRGRLEHRTAGQIAGHPAAVDAFAVSAVSAFGKTTPFVGTEKVETFTTDGPRRVFFEADGTPITPGNFTSTGGTVRLKPDISAADGVSTSTPGFSSFFGTSASAPHAAAIAALMLSGKPDLTVEEVRQAFIDSSFDIEAPGWDRDSGYGLIMADAVLDTIGPFPRGIPGALLLLKDKP